MNDSKTARDKISALPDDILIHILSFLPTKEAFKTSILSSRWELLWASVPGLKFSLKFNIQGHPFAYSGGKERNDRYMNFIDRVLMYHDSNIERFELAWNSLLDNYRLNTWLNFLIRRNIREINIHDDFSHAFNLPLPIRLFTCKTLEVLKLTCYYHFNIPSVVFLPCLKILHVLLKEPCNDLTQKLFCSCPVLEELTIDIDNDLGESIYNISSPALKKLDMKIGMNISKFEKYGTVVHVDAPALESLRIDDASVVHYNLKIPSSILEDGVCFYGIFDWNSAFGKFFTLLPSISTVKYLSLSYCTMEVLGISSEKKWPVFPFLTHLIFDYYDSFDTKSLSRWPLFPSLIHLQLNVGSKFSFEDFSNILTWANNLSTLVLKNAHVLNSLEQGEVPNCLRFCIKEIKLLELDGSNSELKMIKYLLENARALEKLTINARNEMFKNEIVMLPRYSEICQLVFI